MSGKEKRSDEYYASLVGRTAIVIRDNYAYGPRFLAGQCFVVLEAKHCPGIIHTSFAGTVIKIDLESYTEKWWTLYGNIRLARRVVDFTDILNPSSTWVEDE